MHSDVNGRLDGQKRCADSASHFVRRAEPCASVDHDPAFVAAVLEHLDKSEYVQMTAGPERKRGHDPVDRFGRHTGGGFGRADRLPAHE